MKYVRAAGGLFALIIVFAVMLVALSLKSQETPAIFGGRTFALATSCAGRTSTLLRPRPMSVTWPRSRSARCAKTGTPARSMF